MYLHRETQTLSPCMVLCGDVIPPPPKLTLYFSLDPPYHHRSILRVSIKVGILVHEIVVVSNFPFTRSLVVRGKNVEDFSPSQICLKTDHILDGFLIVGAKQNVRVILVLNEELHR